MPKSRQPKTLTNPQRLEAYRSIVEGLSDSEIAERLTDGSASRIDLESIHRLRSNTKMIRKAAEVMAADAFATGAALPFVRVSTLKGLVRKLDHKIEGLSGNGEGFHAESRELREALKQIAQETEGTAGQDAAVSVIDEIREALSERP